jgi:2-polyprenyl-3-methyl-5-hydroxy-6-metoxy-1,4-benzoquinol methylase
MESVPERADKRLLDIGCGQGIWSEFAVESGFRREGGDR